MFGLQLVGGRAHSSLFLAVFSVLLGCSALMSRHLRVSKDRDKMAKVSSSTSSSLQAVTSIPASTRACGGLKSVSSIQVPLMSVSSSDSSVTVPASLQQSCPVVSKSVSVSPPSGVLERRRDDWPSLAGRSADSGRGGPPSESSTVSGPLVGSVSGANVPTQSRTLDAGIGLTLGDVQAVVDGALKKELSPGGALFSSLQDMLKSITAALPAQVPVQNPNTSHSLLGFRDSVPLTASNSGSKFSVPVVVSAAGVASKKSIPSATITSGALLGLPSGALRDVTEPESSSASPVQSGDEEDSVHDEQLREAGISVSDSVTAAHESVLSLLASIVPLAKAVCPEVVTTPAGSSVAASNSTLRLVGAPMSHDKAKLAASVDLEPVLEQAFAYLKTGRPSGGFPTALDHLACPIGGKVHLPTVTAPSRLRRAVLDMPQIQSDCLRTDLPPDFHASSTGSIAARRLKHLEKMVVNSLELQSVADALHSVMFNALFAKSDDIQFRPCNPQDLHKVMQAMVSINFSALETASRLMASIVAWRREDALSSSSADKEMVSRLVSAPFDKSGLFGAAGVAAASLHKDANLSSALVNLAGKPRGSSSDRSASRKRSHPRPTAKAPPSKKPKKESFKRSERSHSRKSRPASSAAALPP